MIFQETVGIDIQHGAVTMVALKGSFRGITTVGHLRSEFGKTASLKENIRLVAERYRSFAADNQIGSPDIYVGLPRDLFFTRTLTLPLLIKENLAQTLRYEMDKYVPIPLDAIYYDFFPYGASKSTGSLNVLLIVTKKEQIDPYFDLIRLLSPGIAGIEPAPIATVNGISHLNGSAGNQSLALVQISGQRMAFDVVCEGITRRWSSRERKEDGALPLAGQVLEKVNNLARDFEPEAGPMAVVIDGGDEASELVSELKKSTDRPVKRLETDATRIPSTDFIGAFGLALRGQVDLPMSTNLLPREYRSKKSKSGYYLMIGLGVLLLLAIGGWGGSKMIHRQIVLERLQVELTHLQKEVRHVDAVAAEIGETEKRIAFIDNVVNTYVPASDILNELSTRIPNSAWVKTLDLSDGALKIHGEAQSASDLLTRLEASPMFRDVRFLSTINKTDDGRENYKIGMKLAE